MTSPSGRLSIMAPKPNPKVAKAFRAMKDLGISEDMVKPALKNLLKLYDKNWEHIEAENYRALIDAIFEIEDEEVHHQPEQPLKRPRPGNQDQDFSLVEENIATTSATFLHFANTNSDTALNNTDPQQLQDTMEPSKLAVSNSNPSDESESDSPPSCLRPRGRRPTSSKALAIAEASEAHQPCDTNETLYLSQMSLKDQHKELVPSHPSEEDNTLSERLSQGAQDISNGKDTEEEFIGKCDSANGVHRVIPPENETSTSFHNSANGITDGVLLLPEDAALSTHGLYTSIHDNESGPADNSIGTVNRKKVLEMGAEKSVSVIKNKWNQARTSETTYLLDATDITKGEENVRISIINHYNDVFPPSFCYINESLVGRKAQVNVSLAQIGKEDCCSTCARDCLSLKDICICTRSTGGRYAYTTDGILNEEFLEECISMTRNPQKHSQFFCEDCPLQVRKDKDAREPCKGHLVRKIIKECWRKCQCSKHCGNRLVQRGISHKLQVFMTSGGKGWGLRTLVDLPKGTFVCEYVGEILTVSELYLRNQSCLGNCADAVVLDAGWASSKEIKEDKALCLDATVYGNVARFINHRCADANLVAIPVEVETPDHFYHRVAFFTSKKVGALEELTRDYGINFNDCDHFTRPFSCRCGSTFCRNMKHYNRKRTKENALLPFDFKI
uniref:SET domain-containing protein n=2 Tax=Kalanchoe fedtschenkoi TaxID=63787 RepID=A0A7N0TUU4_KALFE